MPPHGWRNCNEFILCPLLQFPGWGQCGSGDVYWCPTLQKVPIAADKMFRELGVPWPSEIAPRTPPLTAHVRHILPQGDKIVAGNVISIYCLLTITVALHKPLGFT